MLTPGAAAWRGSKGRCSWEVPLLALSPTELHHTKYSAKIKPLVLTQSLSKTHPHAATHRPQLLPGLHCIIPLYTILQSSRKSIQREQSHQNPQNLHKEVLPAPWAVSRRGGVPWQSRKECCGLGQGQPACSWHSQRV